LAAPLPKARLPRERVEHDPPGRSQGESHRGGKTGGGPVSPKISVVLPVGNRLEFLAEALESVLAQDFADFELIAVLDGVAAEVAAVVEGMRDERIRIIRMPLNLGVSNARNAGLRAARAPYAALMDSDDVALPMRLGTQYDWMEAHPDVTVCGSMAIKLMPDGRRLQMIYPEADGMIKARLLLVDSSLINPTCMLRMEFVRHHGLQYDASLPRDEDHRFFVDVMRAGGTFHGLPQALLLYRRHPGNTTAPKVAANDRARIDLEKARVRELLLPLFFPDLSGNDYALLLRGMRLNSTLALDEIMAYMAALNKAARESRVFVGEDRAEIRRILRRFHTGAMQSLAQCQASRT
jgi:glycosyltransferase involved in cell wall biosynthesis